MRQKIKQNHANRHRAKGRTGGWAHKPDSRRLRVLGVNVAPATKPHTQPRRLVWTTVVNHGKVYPYASTKGGNPEGRTAVGENASV